MGFIYILTNPSFPEYVKIGYADNVRRRVDYFNSLSAVPYAFRIYATYQVASRLEDKPVHELIDMLDPERRTREQYHDRTRTREFFRMTAEEAYRILQVIAEVSGTVNRLHKETATEEQIFEEVEAEEQAAERVQRKPPFKFSMAGLEPGSQVTFDHEPYPTVTIVDDNHVEYEGRAWTLTDLAQHFFADGIARRGPAHFTSHGVPLTILREQREQEEHSDSRPDDPRD